MSDITADVTENTITVSVSGETIAATVSGGQGPQGPTGASGASTWSEITGKPTTLSGYGITDGVTTSDSRLSDSREWSASTVTQAEAEAGTATTRRAFTAQRVFQAIAAWWSASGIQAAIDGKASATHATQHGYDGSDPISPASIGAAAESHTHGAADIFSTLSGTTLSDDLNFLNNNKAASSHTHAASAITSGTFDAGLLPLATTSVRGAVIVGTGLGVSSGTVSVSYGTTSTTACVGNDARLSDSRTPTSHAHGNITDAGAVGSTANLPLITTTSGVITVGSFGSTANTFCAGNDSRLSDARTPTSHAHGNISNAGAIGSTANQIVVTTTSGVLTTATIGSGLTLSGGTLTTSGGGGGSSVGSDLYLWSAFR